MLASAPTSQLARLALLGVSRRAPAALTRHLSSADDTHDDFKPKYKTDGEDVSEVIKNDIASSRIFVYMKGTPAEPQCGFSNMACRILDAYGVQYGSRDVLSSPAVREGIKKFTAWPTIPQVFVDGEFVGGSDILYQMHKDGELEKMFLSNEGKKE